MQVGYFFRAWKRAKRWRLTSKTNAFLYIEPVGGNSRIAYCIDRLHVRHKPGGKNYFSTGFYEHRTKPINGVALLLAGEMITIVPLRSHQTWLASLQLACKVHFTILSHPEFETDFKIIAKWCRLPVGVFVPNAYVVEWPRIRVTGACTKWLPSQSINLGFSFFGISVYEVAVIAKWSFGVVGALKLKRAIVEEEGIGYFCPYEFPLHHRINFPLASLSEELDSLVSVAFVLQTFEQTARCQCQAWQKD